MEQKKNTNQVTQQQTQQQQTSVSPTIDVYGSKIDRNDFINYINQNTDSFFNTYSNMWSNKQKQQWLQQKDALINNIANGNITRVENNSMDITNTDNSGIDSTQGGAGQIIVGMADKVAQEVHNQLEAAKPHKKWTDSTLKQSWLNYFYGGTDPGNYQSWVDRDTKNDKGKRATTNRLAAIREWLNTINPADYTSGLDSFGGQEEFANRLNALKQSLADGTIDNNDYTAADRLGFGNDLRTLLSDDIVSQEDTNVNANEESTQQDSIKPTTDDEIIANAWNGGDPRDIYKQVANTIRNWKKGEYTTRIARASYDSATNYLTNRNKLDKSGVYNVHDINAQQAYYSTKFFPAFFQNFKKEQFFPEYVNNHNNPISTWKGQQGIWQYIADNLTLAIRNRLYGNSILLGKYANELNPVLGLDGKPTGFWTVPESFNETTGTEFIYNPDTGEYKRISLSDPKYKYLMQSYLLGKGINLQQTQDQSQDQSQAYKEGGKIDKLQYGGEFIQGAFDNPQITSLSSLGVQAAPTAQQIAKQKQLAQEQAQQKQLQAEEQKRINAGNRKIQDLGDLNGSDIARLAALGQDIVALGASFVGGYGTATSGVLGLTSMLTDLGADITDDQLTKGDVIKNAAVNTGLAALGMIPGGKSASIVSKLAKNAPKLLAVWGVSKAFTPAKQSLQKVINGGDMTEQDLKNILWGIKSVVSTGTIGRNTYKDWKYSGLRNNKINGTKPAPSKYEISVNKNNTQQKVTLSQEQYSAINKAKTQIEANAKLRQYLANNGEQEADKFSFRDGLFPEKASKNPFHRNKDVLNGKEIPQANNTQGRDVYQRANDLRKLRNPTLSKYLNTDYDVYVNGKYPIKNINIPFPHFKFKKFQDRYVEPIKPKQTSSVEDNAKPVDTDILKQTGDTPKPTNDTSTSSTGENDTQTPPTNNPNEGSTSTGVESPTVTNPYPEGYRPPEDYSEIARNIVNSNNQQKFNIKIPQKDLITKVKESPKQLLDPIRSKIQNLFIPGEDINRNNLATFIKNNSKLFNKLNKKDKEFLKSASQPSLLGKASAEERKKVLDIVSKMITHIDKKSNKQQAIEAKKQALANIRYKHGGILYAKDGVQLPWYSTLQDYNPTKYTTQYGNTLYGRNVNNQYNNNLVYGNAGNGLGTSRYKPDERYSDFTAIGQNNAKNIENQQYYKQFTNDLVNSYNQYIANPTDKNNLFYRWAHVVDATLPKGSLSTFFDDNDKLRTSWDIKNYDAYGRNTIQKYTNGLDYLLHNRNDQLLANRHNDFLKEGTRYFYIDNAGNKHWVSPEDAQKYTISKTGTSSIDGNIKWIDYEITNPTKLGGANPDTMQKSHVLTDVLNGLKNHLPNIAEAARVGWNNSFNNRQRDYQLQHMNPVLLQPYAFYRKIYGDYGTMSEYNRQGANTQNVANNIASNTADGSLAAATQLQGASQANDLEIKGKLADNQMIRDTYEKALAQNKENLQIANNVTNTNRQNLNNNERERAQVVLATNTMNHQNWDKFWQAQDLKAQHSQDERDAMQKYLDYASVMNNNSRMWDPKVKEITNRYRQQYLDATTDEERYAIANKMQEELTSLGYQKQDSLLNALAQLRGLKYSYTPVWKAKVTIPTTATPTYAAKGGTLNVTKLATTAVKEKNKDIERMYKDWSKKDDRFFNQLGKLRQARFDKIIKIK